jgi:hypothetical protein
MQPTIRFCETHYAVLPWIAEFGNTLSNAGYLAAAWYAPSHRPCLRSARLALVGVGVGSALLHGLATHWAQLLDEAAMLMLVLSLVRCVLVDTTGLDCATIAGTGLYLASGYHPLFVALFFALVSVLLWHSPVRTFRICSSWMSLAFAAWLLEQHTCMWGWWGHMVWHLASAWAVFCYICSV